LKAADRRFADEVSDVARLGCHICLRGQLCHEA
jgi:hypothetical protein